MSRKTTWGVTLALILVAGLAAAQLQWQDETRSETATSTAEPNGAASDETNETDPAGLRYRSEPEQTSANQLPDADEPEAPAAETEPQPASEETEADEEDPTGARIRGKVVDEWGAPIEGAGIFARRIIPENAEEDGEDEERGRRGRRNRGSRAESDAEGEFELTGLEAGDHRLTSWSERHLAGEPLEVSVREGEIYEGAIITLKEGLRLEGRVVSKSGGHGLAGARVDGWLRDRRRRAFRRATADDQGYFTMTGLTPDGWQLRARADGHLSDRIEITIPEEGPQELMEIELETGAYLSGTILGPEGEPLPEARVFVLEGDDYAAQAGSDEEGGYQTSAVRPGSYTIFARNRDYSALFRREVQLTSEGEQHLDITLELQGKISGVVVDPQGDPVERAMVYVEESEGRVDRRERTNEEGHFEVDSLYGGSYRIRAFSRGYAPSEPATFEVTPAGQAPEIVLPLRAGSRLTGTVHASGAPVDRAMVVLVPTDQDEEDDDGRRRGRNETERTEDGGQFEMTSLEPGRYEIFARSDDYQFLMRMPLEIREGEELPLDIPLEPAATISGTLKLPESEQQQDDEPGVEASRGPSFSIRAYSLPNRTVQRRGRVQADGSFTIRGLYPGEYEIEIRGSDAPDEPVKVVRVSPGQRVTGLELAP